MIILVTIDVDPEVISKLNLIQPVVLAHKRLR